MELDKLYITGGKTQNKLKEVREPRERAYLVAVHSRSDSKGWSTRNSLEELVLLASTAGVDVVGSITQNLPSPSHRYYIGEGKLEYLSSLKSTTPYDVVICDTELSPIQQKNLSESLRVKVIDRTTLILDIFAKRAHTKEGQLQVEMAQLDYLLPRLAGQWKHLERLGGGIGTRGPGEKQIESDRRIIKKKMNNIKRELEGIGRHRLLYRQHRKKADLPVVALVGYTNAGKSTLFNALTHANVFVQDKLFATLDPTTRRVRLPENNFVLLTDTVGFIQNLPTTLVAAFKATLEELEDASLILQLVDISNPHAAEQNQTVERLLKDLKLDDRPRILVLNKIDLYSREEEEIKNLSQKLQSPNNGNIRATVIISAIKNWGLEKLMQEISRTLLQREGATKQQKYIEKVEPVEVM